jgi:hypothetical protein
VRRSVDPCNICRIRFPSVQAVPYWIDDESLVSYMLACAEPTVENNEEAGAKERTRGAQPPVAFTPNAPSAEEHDLSSLSRNRQAVDLFRADGNPAPRRALQPVSVIQTPAVCKLMHQKQRLPHLQ